MGLRVCRYNRNGLVFYWSDSIAVDIFGEASFSILKQRIGPAFGPFSSGLP